MFAGSTTLNGVDIHKYKLNDYRNNIGVALQNSNIFALSIKDNMSRSGLVGDSEIESALNKLALKNVINKCDQDYSRQLTNEFNKSGIELSGGERQKIAIASLLSRKFGLLIFDEPSSSLDPISELELSKIIFNKSNESATIVISHKLFSVDASHRLW